MPAPDTGFEQPTQPVGTDGQQGGDQPPVQTKEEGHQETVPELMGEQAPELQLTPEEYEQQINAFKTKSQDEVNKRQQLERERDYLYQVLAQQQQLPQQQTKEDPLAGLSDEDIVDVATVKKMVGQMLESQIQQHVDRPAQAIQQTLTKLSINQARLAHDDYNEVYNLCDEMVKNDPSGRLFSFIQNSPDPGEEIYRIGMTHQNYIQNQVQKAGKKVAQTIQQNSNKPPTLSNMGATGNRKADAVRRIKEWTADETEAEITRVMNGE